MVIGKFPTSSQVRYGWHALASVRLSNSSDPTSPVSAYYLLHIRLGHEPATARATPLTDQRLSPLRTAHRVRDPRRIGVCGQSAHALDMAILRTPGECATFCCLITSERLRLAMAGRTSSALLHWPTACASGLHSVEGPSVSTSFWPMMRSYMARTSVIAVSKCVVASKDSLI